MSFRSLTHEEQFEADPNSVFAMLHTPSAIRKWWSASRAIVLARPGGLWAATWGDQEDDPDYICCATITTFDPPRLMVLGNYQYASRGGPLPFEADFVTRFEVAERDSGTLLRVVQQGFPRDPCANDFFTSCRQGWIDTFAGIRDYLALARPDR